VPNSAIKPGDVVRLKSGGLEMTVYAIDNAHAKCYYIDLTLKVQEQIPIAVVALEKVIEATQSRPGTRKRTVSLG
jgi:NMD protein affecting ribosome stability and mRNA decay